MPTATRTAEDIRAHLILCLSRRLRVAASSIDPGVELTRYGLDSLESVSVIVDLEDLVGIPLPDDLLFDHATADSAAAAVLNLLASS